MHTYQTVDVDCTPQVYDYYAGGADTESTVRDNRAVYGRYRLLPRYMVDVSHCDLSYTLLGKHEVDAPHKNSACTMSAYPTRHQRARRACCTPMVLSCYRAQAEHAHHCGTHVTAENGA